MANGRQAERPVNAKRKFTRCDHRQDFDVAGTRISVSERDPLWESPEKGCQAAVHVRDRRGQCGGRRLSMKR